jgi:hypothetical protein
MKSVSAFVSFGAVPAFIFPLTINLLLTLIEYNELRAIITNLSFLSSMAILYWEFHSGPWLQKSRILTVTPVPRSLVPTSLRMSTPHTPWIDTFPLAVKRENVIEAAANSDFDEHEPCSKIFCTLFKGRNEAKVRRGLVVWGYPWDVKAGEIKSSVRHEAGVFTEGVPGTCSGDKSVAGSERRGALICEYLNRVAVGPAPMTKTYFGCDAKTLIFEIR